MNGNCFCEEKMEKEKVKFSTLDSSTKRNCKLTEVLWKDSFSSR